MRHIFVLCAVTALGAALACAPVAAQGSDATEAEFNKLLAAEHLPQMPNDNSKDSRDRRRLFVAIARGVVRHLDERRTAITVTMPSSGGTRSPVFDIEGKDW